MEVERIRRTWWAEYCTMCRSNAGHVTLAMFTKHKKWYILHCTHCDICRCTTNTHNSYHYVNHLAVSYVVYHICPRCLPTIYAR
jgi:hypothetical protein